MNSKYEDICSRNDLMCTENEELNDKNEALKSKICGLQVENSEMEVRINALTHENEVNVVENKDTYVIRCR